MRKRARHSGLKGFTLLELCVSVFILAVLAILLASANSRITEHSRSTTCTHRLRQIGILYRAYLAENNGVSRLFTGGDVGITEYGWYKVLQRKGHLTDAAAQKAFGCPSMDWKKVGAWWCYGFRTGGAPGVAKPINDGQGGVYEFRVAAVEEPSRFLMIGDTATNDTLEKQSFRFLRSKNPDSRLHLRHKGRANGWFLDGHIRALTPADLHNVGIADVYDSEGNIVQTKP